MSAAGAARAAWTGLWVWLLALAVGAAFTPLVVDGSFLVDGGLGAAAVVLTGVLLRAVAAPRAAVVTAEGAVAVGWLTAVYGAGTGIAGVVPTGATLDQARAVSEATYQHAQRYAAPVPDLQALDATLAALVIGLVLVIDVMASELHWAPALGLVLLAVLMIPATLLGGETQPWSFVLGALAYAGLLAQTRRDDAGSWGPRMVGVAESASRPAAPAVLNRIGATVPAAGIAVAAVAIAMVVPAMAPTASTNLFGGGGSGAGGNGTGLDNPVLDMRRNLRGQSPDVMLTIQEVEGSPRPRYVRLASLQAVGARGWTLGDRVGAGQQLDDDLPAIPGLNAGVDRRDVRYTASVAPGFDTRWLPLVYAPTAIALDEPDGVEVNRSMLDVSRIARLGSFAGETYTFDASLVRPTESDMRTAPASTLTMSSFVDLPENTPDVVAARAEEVTAGADNAFDRAVALQRWFRQDGGFEYSLDQRAGSGMETIEDFLTDDRVGYCEQFATAMAMMARSLGIPARVSIGFLSGQPGRLGNSWVFRGTDMHAWPELYFAGIGWVGFEPTPGGSGYTPPTFAEGEEEELQGPSSSLAPTAAPTTAPTAAPGRETGPAAQDGTGDSSSRTMLMVVVGAILLLLLATPAVVRAERRRRRMPRGAAAPTVENAWAEVRDTATDLGLGWTDGASPRATVAPLRARLRDDPDVREALDALVGAVERSRYAPAYEPVDLKEVVKRLRQAMADTTSRGQHAVALILPRSVLVTREQRGTAQDADEVLSLRE
jgi:transglutaminase-like putative cysteine protease